jgi:hypothetical protein
MGLCVSKAKYDKQTKELNDLTRKYFTLMTSSMMLVEQVGRLETVARTSVEIASRSRNAIVPLN